MLTYDVVIATRNRAAALRLSIPRMLQQSRRPQRIIVVDSSDDHPAVKHAVQGVAVDDRVQVEVIQVPPGLPRQRNAGLERVNAPIVFFPDDDSIWHPGTAEAIMRCYERDEAGEIAAVCAAEAPEPPPGFAESAAAAYRMRRSHRVKQRLAHGRARIERSLAPDPFILHGRSLWPDRPAPAWLGEENAVRVEWMTGFRMSFRTEVIRRCGFDETFAGYALFEDVDASFAAMRHGMVIGARDARVYHYRSPGGRGNARNLGVTQILNRAFVVCKHSPPGSEARRRLAAYSAYKCLQHAMASPSRYGRRRFAGAAAAMRWVPKLCSAPAADLPSAYNEAMAACLEVASPAQQLA